MKISFAIPLGVMLWLGGSWTQVAAQEPGACSRDASSDAVTLVGRVVDEASEVPLPSAVVTAEWTNAEAGALRAEARTEPDGFYRLCRLPIGVPLTLQASFGDRTTDPVTARLESPPVAYDFHLPPAEGPGVTVETRQRAGPGRIVGRALDAESLKPVEEAVVSLRRAAGPEAGAGPEADPEAENPPLQALTNSQGRFLIRDVPGGTYGLELRHVAYGTVHEPIGVPANRTLEVELRVPPVALEMEPIVVSAVRDRRLEIKGFYERKEWGEKLGLGHFIDREYIERWNLPHLSTLMWQVPGVLQVRCRGSDCVFVTRAVRSKLTDCRTAPVYVDGIRGPTPPISAIAGIEVYVGPASLPAEFGGSDGQCGAIVIWTRTN